MGVSEALAACHSCRCFLPAPVNPVEIEALAQQSGQTLPPELVQDMMIKALDKYKAAGAVSLPNS